MSAVIVLLVLASVAVWGVLTYNRLVALRDRVDSAWRRSMCSSSAGTT